MLSCGTATIWILMEWEHMHRHCSTPIAQPYTSIRNAKRRNTSSISINIMLCYSNERDSKLPNLDQKLSYLHFCIWISFPSWLNIWRFMHWIVTLLGYETLLSLGSENCFLLCISLRFFGLKYLKKFLGLNIL